jgi:hypothetical protein
MMKPTPFASLLILALLAFTLSASAQSSKRNDWRRGPAETVTLFSRTTYKDHSGGYGKSAFSFKHGVRSDIGTKVTRNNYELLYGNINWDGDSDWFTVTMVTDDRSRIKDLGPLEWAEIDSLPLLSLNAAAQQGVRFPSKTETFEESSRGRVTRVVEGHVYLLRSKDTDSDFYTIFRVEKLLPNDQVTIGWRLIPSLQQDRQIPR